MIKFNIINMDYMNYGYMNFEKSKKITSFKILKLSPDLDVIMPLLMREIIWNLIHNIQSNILFFKYDGITEQQISYDKIIDDDFPWLHIQLCDVDDIQMAYFYGDRWLYQILRNNLNIFDDYSSYVQEISNMTTKELVQQYVSIFGVKPKFIFRKKLKIIKHLLKHFKYQLITECKLPH